MRSTARLCRQLRSSVRFRNIAEEAGVRLGVKLGQADARFFSNFDVYK